MKLSRIFPLMIVLGACLFWPDRTVHAASLYLTSGSQALKKGDTCAVDLKLNSDNVGVNAAQATIQYLPETIEITSVETAGSVFNFWLVQPTISNANGRVTFIGGSTSGFSGQALQILRLYCKVKGNGAIRFTLTDGAVTAADGSGTNVLSTTKGLQLQSTGENLPGELPPLTRISRPTVPAAALPPKPNMSVPLYPHQGSWYNAIAPFSVQWDLPRDVTAVATAVDQKPFFEPEKDEGLFDSKPFVALGDGTWYIHIRYKNTKGWGPTAHYTISIDSTPPTAFNIDIQGGTPTDNPSPTISYATTDQPSGILMYTLKIDHESETTTTQSSFRLSPLQPGKHVVIVKAFDGAGNFAQSFVEINALPIASPRIISLNTTAYVGEGGVSIVGSSASGTTVLLRLLDEQKAEVFTTSINADENESWSAVIDQPLKKGTYTIEAVAQDHRDAQSLPVLSNSFTVIERPAFVMFGLIFSQTTAFSILIALLLLAFLLGWRSQFLTNRQRGWKVDIVQRDVSGALTRQSRDIDKLLEILDKDSDTKEDEIRFHLTRMNEQMKKVQSHLSDNIGDIKT